MPDVIGWAVANWIEALGFATGIASVWLFARQHVDAWPVGILTFVTLSGPPVERLVTAEHVIADRLGLRP